MVLTTEGFQDGHVGFEGGRIVEVGRGRARESVAEGIVIPTLINAHTHVAAFGVPVDLSLPLAEMVAPPDGLKYRVLSRTPSHPETAIAEMSDPMFRKAYRSSLTSVKGAWKVPGSCPRHGSRPSYCGCPGPPFR